MGAIYGLMQLAMLCGTTVAIAFGVLLAWPGSRFGEFVYALVAGIAAARAEMKANEDHKKSV